MTDAVQRLRAWGARVRAGARAQLAAAERFYLAMLDRAGIDVDRPKEPSTRGKARGARPVRRRHE